MEKKLSILVSNDDGIFSDGLGMLVKELQTIAAVTIVAPDSQQGACSH